MSTGERHTGAGLAAPVALAVALAAIARVAEGTPPVGASTPPRGLNTWDSFRYWATEDNLLANGAVMKDAGLVASGWEYMVIDEGWYRWSNNTVAGPNMDGYCAPNNFSIDTFGRFVPSTDRFPSSTGAAGLTPVCSKLAALGIKCGVHFISGVPQKAVHEQSPIKGTHYTVNEIAWKDGMGVPPASNGINMSHPGAALYIKTVVEQLQGWGVKFIKLDFGPSELEVKAYADAINATGSGIILSVNSGQGHDYCNMYRISSDMWDVWGDVSQQLDTVRNYFQYARPGSWPDGDMIPLGRIGGVRSPINKSEVYPTVPGACTAEQLSCGKSNDTRFRYEECCPRQSRLHLATEGMTLLNMLVVGRSPLMFGGYLPETHTALLALLANTEALRVNSHAANVTEVVRNFTRYTAAAAPGANYRAWVSTPIPVPAAAAAGLGLSSGARLQAAAPPVYTSADRYIALFNEHDNATQTVVVDAAKAGMGKCMGKPTTCKCKCRDLWAGRSVPCASVGGVPAVAAALAPHASVLYAMYACE